MQKYVTFRKKGSYKNENFQKVRDHYHHTSEYREAAHSNCNLKCNVPNEIL